MCSEMSQYMPNTADSSETLAIAEGSAAQPGRPDWRWAKAAALARILVLPLRWPVPSRSNAKVSSVAAVVAMAISPSAAPPAGSSPCA